MSVSTTLTDTTVTTSPDGEVTVVASTSSTEVVSASENIDAVIVAATATTTLVTASANTEALISAATPSSTTVTVTEETVTIDTTVDAPIQIASSADTVAEISIVQDVAATINVTADVVVAVSTLENSTVEIVTTPTQSVELTVTVDEVSVIETPAAQGPPGRPGEQGLQGPAGGETQYPTLIPLSGHIVVRALANGTIAPASSTSTESLATIVGLTNRSWSAGDLVSLQQEGFLDHNGWSFTAGQRVFVGTNGALVQTLPPGAIFMQSVGIMLSPTRLLINIEAPIVI